MNGMHHAHGFASSTSSTKFTQSYHFELPATSAVIQLSLSGYFELYDKATAELGITRVEYVDLQGVTQHTDYHEGATDYPLIAAINKLTRVDWQIRVSNCWADYLLNMFYWDWVY